MLFGKKNRRSTISNIAFIFTLLVLLTQVGCEVNDSSDSDARIIIGESIDGIHLGEYPEAIEERLGSNKLIGFADGSRGWTIYSWPDSVYSGLCVYFIEMDVGELGPADYLAVEAPYDGTTKEGIGIGTNIRDVYDIWGEPVRISESSITISLTYDLNGKSLFLRFRDSLLEHLQFGPFIPYDISTQ